MIPTLRLRDGADRARVESLLQRLRLDPRQIAFGAADDTAAVQKLLADVAERGDDAIVDIARRFDDPGFTADHLRITPDEMRDAAHRVPARQLSAIRRSIAQVREYQQHVMPQAPKSLQRSGVELGMRFTPLDSVGLYFPGGKASYPSSLIMLAVPAQVAGVGRIVVCSPGGKFGRSDLVLAVCHELGLADVFRAGGAAAIGAMAFGTRTIPAVDKIVGPGNRYVQLAKRLLAGCVGLDGFLGPSEILTLADETGRPDFIAADLLAQAEHDPGSCFLLTTSPKLAADVTSEIARQVKSLTRTEPIEKSLRDESAIVIDDSMDALIDLANCFAAEHVNVQTKDDDAVLAKLRHAGAVFLGPWSPVAAGDYVAGPSHCLPTNTTARFSSGISVYEFLKRTSVERYDAQGLGADAEAIETMALAEGLDAHAASVRVRTADERR
jgi:histidinol dehydrogenase